MTHFRDMVVLRANSESVPLIFPVGEDGLAAVSAMRLGLRFQLQHDSIHVDEEIFDPESGMLTHTIGQVPSSVGDDTLWTLKPGRYRAYGVSNILDPSSLYMGPLPRSSSGSFQTPPASHMKIESRSPVVTILSSESEEDLLDEGFNGPHLPSPSVLPPNTSLDSVEASVRRVHSKLGTSVIDRLRALRNLKGCRNALAKLDYNKILVHRVTVLPPSFNGDVIFELPAAENSGIVSQAKQMAGMDKRYDGHVWTKTVTTNIVNREGLSFRKSLCLGHLRCQNSDCEFLTRIHRTKDVNELEWEGHSPTTLEVGKPHPSNSTLVCKICKEPPSCIAQCSVQVYYVGGNSALTRAFVHLGSHAHPVKDGELRDMQHQTRALIGEQLERTPSATNSSIVIEATKELLGGLLLCPDGDQPKTLVFDDLVPLLDKCKYISSPNIRNEVTSFKYLRKFGVIDSITKLRGCSTWAFVQESKFPSQGTDVDKVFVFKMSEVGPGSGVDLVKRMQLGGDLQDAWLMFDHVQRVKEWTTMACHVYDSAYCRVMSIACCDMQSEDCTAQVLFWKNLNSVLQRNGVAETQFKGFMADSAQANWNAVRLVYGSGDISEPMPNRERTCLFHWTQSMEKHTKADIRGDLQDQHRLLCKQYKNAISSQQSEERYLAIRAWWLSSGATTEAGLHRLELWLSFWHFRYRQWGGFMQLDLTTSEKAEMPSCNLAETVHNKWLQQSGNRGNDLYIATVDDFVRAFMQMVKYYQYLKGNEAGTGPGKEELLLRVAQRSAERTGNPKSLTEALSKMQGVEDFINRQPHLKGQEIFGSQKRKADMPLGCEFDSHRPDKVNFSHPRIQTRASRATTSAPELNPILEDDAAAMDVEVEIADEAMWHVGQHSTRELTHVSAIQETSCDEMHWHIARLPKTSAKACFALQAITKKKCIARIIQNNVATAAPTYTGMMVNYKKNQNDRMQFFFCNDDIERCVKGTRRKWVLSVPPLPAIWPVKMGTKLSKSEILALESAGFVLPQRQVISPRRLFGGEAGVELISAYPIPSLPDEHPTTRSGKVIRRNPRTPTTKQQNNLASALTLNAGVDRVTMVPHPGFGCIVSLNSGVYPRNENYMLTISSYSECSCPNFKSMMLSCLGKRGSWANCKHLYYIFTVICNLQGATDVFIHAPSFSFNEVKQILLSGILNHLDSN